MAEEFRLLTGAELEVTNVSDLQSSSDMLTADAIVYPTERLPELAKADALRPVKPGELADPKLHWQDVLPSAREHDAAWGADVVALPLGAPVLACFYRADLLAAIHREPPRTWREYGELAALLSNRAAVGVAQPVADERWQATIEPLADGWRGWMLLARAASYSRHPDYYSTVFDLDSMEPRLTAPPFVRALEEMVAISAPDKNASLEATPSGALDALLAGRCALAIGWLNEMSADRETKVAPDTAQVTLLPGATEMFDPATRQWTDGKGATVRHVPLLGVTGLLGSVTKSSQEPEAALQLLVWISGEELSAKLATSNRAAPYRASQLAGAIGWRWQRVPDAVTKEYGNVLEETSRQPLWLDALRVPGRTEYLAALDQAVATALRQEAAPQEALAQAAAAWQSITDKLGRDAQRRAYRQSLGIAP